MCAGFSLKKKNLLVDRDMLTRVWNEMDYRIDVCRITKGEFEHL
jgi:hypothetical protein